jgi:hypothetical protein
MADDTQKRGKTLRAKVPDAVPEVGKDNPPTWTLTAADRLDILILINGVSLAQMGGYPNKDRLAAMEAKLREFELYEERYHR